MLGQTKGMLDGILVVVAVGALRQVLAGTVEVALANRAVTLCGRSTPLVVAEVAPMVLVLLVLLVLAVVV